jgi:Organic solute transporter Ostalpha
VHSTDPHLIAWFSAGAFVLLGFPVSMWGILGHLTNYNAPHIQVYIVRILWMVPIYSIESWLAMRFHKKAVLIETARDVYESFVLYCFLQFLIEVLGGEEALVLMLKDKSPTRGVHMWGLQWCGVKPWLMGQPVRRSNDDESDYRRGSVVERVTAAMSPTKQHVTTSRVHWTSPFFIKCKFGVLQYVLLKFLCAVAVLLLEWKGWYKEGQFHWKAGYLYICILTNVSQCWAVYCLIFFYYATKTELSPIRPVGKFLSVKALVFFTWWQSVFISVLYQMDMIPTYRAAERDWSSDDVAKGIQDYLICMEMFIAAVVHTVVFPHSEYSVAAVRARANAIHQRPGRAASKRLGRRRKQHQRSNTVVVPESAGLELISLDDDAGSVGTWDEPPLRNDCDNAEDAILLSQDNNDPLRPGLFRAFMDSAIPRDLRDNTVNIMRGEYHVEKKTLLHHAATSDQYDLFSARRAFTAKKLQKPKDDNAS